jgi:N-acetyl-alpha-D-glucosaminyl L-malate synthase BshA
MNVGILCYASVGGSGVVATELGRSLAARGHRVHIISTDVPFRQGEFQAGLSFHQVMTPTYPLFREPQYLLSLANRVVQVAREFSLDIIHAHYAVPHATAALLARQVLASTWDAPTPKLVATLHGTDITLVGNDPSYSEIVAYSIEQSDVVTAVSESLRTATYRELGVKHAIEVIPNFLDCATHHCVDVPDLRRRFAPDPETKLVIHVSNFRPVKRIDALMEIFARIRRQARARLLLVGDGPELGTATRLARQLGVAEHVEAVGAQEEVQSLLSIADVFLLPSAQESFGLAALEAMACEVPVVASAVGGLPEVIEHGLTGFLHPPDDLDAMAASALAVLRDPALRRALGQAARARVADRFCAERVVPMYEACYKRAIESIPHGGSEVTRRTGGFATES